MVPSPSSLDALPEDILIEISSRTGASSLSAILNLRLVSRLFRRICDHQRVISKLSLQEISLSPWDHNPTRYSNFMRRCRENENADALYRSGFLCYFRDNHEPRGLELLSQAADKGNKEAKYVYGLILICLGGTTKQEGYQILSSLINPSSKSTTIKELMELRHKIKEITEGFWDRDNIRQLKTGYVRECNCNVKTTMYAGTDCIWHQEFYTVDAYEIGGLAKLLGVSGDKNAEL